MKEIRKHLLAAKVGLEGKLPALKAKTTLIGLDDEDRAWAHGELIAAQEAFNNIDEALGNLQGIEV